MVRLCNHLFKRTGSIYIDVFGYEVEVHWFVKMLLRLNFHALCSIVIQYFLTTHRKLCEIAAPPSHAVLGQWKKIPLGLELNKCYCVAAVAANAYNQSSGYVCSCCFFVTFIEIICPGGVLPLGGISAGI